MAWKFDDSRSIYVQLVEQIQVLILTGTYPPGGRLPAVRELASEAGVNPNTMQRALAELERTGLVHSNRTSGRFVTEDSEMIEALKRSFARNEALAFCGRLRTLGYTTEEIVLLIRGAETDDSGENEKKGEPI